MQRFDEDGSGTISWEEFVKSLRAAKDELERRQGCAFPTLALSDHEMRSLFHKYDSDGSGDISWDEFLCGLTGGSGPHMDAIKKLKQSKQK